MGLRVGGNINSGSTTNIEFTRQVVWIGFSVVVVDNQSGVVNPSGQAS